MVQESKDPCIEQKKLEEEIRTPYSDDDSDLAQRFRPLLVLFPEIEYKSERKKHHNPDYKLLDVPPLDQDYHPRDINLIMDNAHLPPTGIYRFLQYLKISPPKPKHVDELLKAMDEDKLTYIDILGKGGPKHVDKYWNEYSKITNKDHNYKRKAYARVVRGEGKFKDFISIQYWMAYFFDDWANVHEMDWEMVSVFIKKEDANVIPVACVYNAHNGSFRKPWKDVHRASNERPDEKPNKQGELNGKGLHPVVYVANGSHASYFSDYPSFFNVLEKYVKPRLQTMIRMVNIGTGFGTEFTDYVLKFDDEQNVRVFPEIETIPEPGPDGKWSEQWRWLNFTGKWGAPAELSLIERLISEIPILRIITKVLRRPVQESGPSGPNARPGRIWDDPFDWVNIECLDDVPSEDWLRKNSCIR